MAGYVIYNGFWNPDRIPDPVERLVNAAESRGLELTPFANTNTAVELGGLVSVYGFDVSDFVLFWDKDIRLARALETIGVRSYNSADTIAVCDDKAATHLKLAAEGIPMPTTLVAPMTYVSMDIQQAKAFFDSAEETLGYPMVVKECYGSLGGQVYLAENRGELNMLAEKIGARPFICQKFIASSAGTDIRIYVVDDKPIAAMRRSSDTDFRANIGNGGKAESYIPTKYQMDLSVRCCQILKAQFAGVDLLMDEQGEPLICEVNSNAHMAAITECTGVDVAGEIIDSVLMREGQR